MVDAKAVLDQAKSNGVKGDGFNQLEKRLGSLKEAPAVKEPTKNQLQALINLYTKGQHKEALNQASKLLTEFPNSVTLYNIVGVANQGLGNLDEAIEAYQKAIDFKPDHFPAHYSLGTIFQNLDRLDEALDSYIKAAVIKPNDFGVYNNLGIVLQMQGKLNEAVTYYNKAVATKPNYAEAYNNMGVALQAQDKTEDAKKAYLTALKIKPDYHDAYNNVGDLLRKQGKLEEAMKAYHTALSIKLDNAEVHCNMGNIFQEQGELEKAIEAYNKTIAINPGIAEAWNNIYFVLEAIKTKISLEEALALYGPKDSGSVVTNIAYGILQYRLHRGREREGNYFDEALKILSSAENIFIKNPAFDKNLNNQIQALPDKMVALVHFGRSGTGLMHSLVDGHPEVSTLPSVYLSEYFAHSTWEKIISAGWDKMVDRFISIYEVLFDASSPVPIETAGKKYISSIGQKEGMMNVGDERNEVLSIDEEAFRSELNRLMACYDKLDAFIFFKLVHAAFDKAIKDQNNKDLIFYHIHNPSTHAKLNFVRSTPEANWILMVREPLQSCESWIRISLEKNEYTEIANKIISVLFEIDNIVYKRQCSFGVRLEDLKEYPQKTIRALCDWMGIEEVESLYEMTAQGKKWWGDPGSPDYSKEGMDPFGKTSINRKVGSIFSENDQFILRTLFYPFSVRFGYVEENTVKFKEDLQKVRPMIDQMFDFEKDIAEKMQMSFEQFMSSGSYLYLRSGLVERWNTLNECNTYPNMIKPLKI
jgi:tetratricopeptide (TPR) repeat protein